MQAPTIMKNRKILYIIRLKHFVGEMPVSVSMRSEGSPFGQLSSVWLSMSIYAHRNMIGTMN